jgi:CRISPR-associated protein Csb1
MPSRTARTPSARSDDPAASPPTAPLPSGKRPSPAEFTELVETKTVIRLSRDTQILEPVGGPADPVAPTLFGDVRNRAAPPELQSWSSTTKNSYWYGRGPDGEPTVCVTLSSIAKEANAAEDALRAARAGGAEVPDILVDFTKDKRTAHLGRIGALQAPHRGFDALLRDSLLGNDLFHASDFGIELTEARITAATPLLALPHMLILGAWHSTGASGGGGTKIGRVYKSEIIGYGAMPADIAASRIDPAAIVSSVPIYKARGGGAPGDLFTDKSGRRPNPGWETDKAYAELKDDGTPIRYVSKKREQGTTPGTASLLNHGNVKPSARSGRATITGAVHVMDLSLTAIRCMSFPANAGDPPDPARNRLAWTALAALALVAMTHRLKAGYHLRSGCDLVPREKPRLEVIGDSLAECETFTIDPEGARSLLRDAVAALRGAGMPWGPPAHAGVLKPTIQVIEAVHASKGLAEEAEATE